MTTPTPLRNIPDNFAPAALPDGVPAGSEAYLSPDGCAFIAFRGRATKSTFYYRYPTAQQCANGLTALTLPWAEREESKRQARAAQKAAVCPFKVGDILDGSYGYEQTNVLFWRIESTKGRRLTLRKLGKKTVSGDGWAGTVVPCEATNETAVSIAQFIGEYWYALDDGSYRLTAWDGKPKYESSYH